MTRGIFGGIEEIGIIRSGFHGKSNFGTKKQWEPFLQFDYDYELINNMDEVLSDRHTVSVTAGLSYLLARGQRIHLKYTRHQGLKKRRTGNSFVFIATIDF